jgi:hypothetical protein
LSKYTTPLSHPQRTTNYNFSIDSFVAIYNWQPISSGDKVIIAENGFLLEVSPDSSRKVVKEIGKPVKVTKRFFTIVN